MIQDLVHRAIVQNLDEVAAWFERESEGLFFPFYSSFDVRDSGFKVAPVDANIFPAGFNNICPTDQESSEDLVRDYFHNHFPTVKKVLLLTEEHTQNPYYWDNVATLQHLLQSPGLDVKLAFPRDIQSPLQLTSASGKVLLVEGARRRGDGLDLDGWQPDLVISNNDFSEAYQEWIQGLKTPINPPHELGWHRRRKDEFFAQYNDLAKNFCSQIGIDPWLLQVRTRRFSEFDLASEENRKQLALTVDEEIDRIRQDYAERKISTKPFVFIKNSAGTYGLGVTQVESGADVLSWSYKSRKKMKAAKGGRDIEEVIIQEGVPTTLTSSGATAEPTIYMIGCRLAGGFLRTHESKGPRESLNSPGAVFRRLCVSDLKISVEGHPMENVYGWVAQISFLAIAREAAAHQITCPHFRCECKS